MHLTSFGANCRPIDNSTEIGAQKADRGICDWLEALIFQDKMSDRSDKRSVSCAKTTMPGADVAGFAYSALALQWISSRGSSLA